MRHFFLCYFRCVYECSHTKLMWNDFKKNWGVQSENKPFSHRQTIHVKSLHKIQTLYGVKKKKKKLFAICPLVWVEDLKRCECDRTQRTGWNQRPSVTWHVYSALFRRRDFDCNWLFNVALCCSLVTPLPSWMLFSWIGHWRRMDQWPLQEKTNTLKEQHK